MTYVSNFGTRDLLFLNFGTLHISEMVEIRNFKFGRINIDHERH